MLRVEALNQSLIRIHTERSIHLELADRFTFVVPGYKFMPAFKSGRWNGKLKCYNAQTGTIARGLLPDIRKFAAEFGYQLTLDASCANQASLREVDEERLDSFIRSLQLPTGIAVRDFQQDALVAAFQHKRAILVSATGSGKSLIIYMLLRACLPKRILLLVPTVSLVDQMYNDFSAYAAESGWDVESFCQKIYAGQSKEITKQLVISTWQSAVNLPNHDRWDMVICDEVHLATAASISSIMQQCTNAAWRFGLTGTLKAAKCDQMVLRGLFGETHEISRTKELIDRGLLAQLTVKMLLLKYGKPDCLAVKGVAYQDELSHTLAHPKRLNLVANIASTIKGNSLFLVSRVTDHGTPLFSAIKAACPDHQVFFVSGSSKPEERQRVRKLAESRNDVIIVATYQVFSTGVNIVNLQNVIFASPPGKSEILVLQSIGRGLRRGVGKDQAVLIDIVDDYSNGKKTKNMLFRHAIERSKYYDEQQFDVKHVSLENFT